MKVDQLASGPVRGERFIGMTTTREGKALAVYSLSNGDAILKFEGRKIGTLRPESQNKLHQVFETVFTQGTAR